MEKPGETSGYRSRLRATEDQFILEWGRLSSSWGINRTMAQIHAFLLIAGRPLSMDDIIERLHISRGNASMNLRDLMDWGIIQRFRRPGDRKDVYVCDSDVWLMFSRVVRERKRREIDPTVSALHECLTLAPEASDSPEAAALRNKLAGLLEIFSLIDQVYKRIFESEAAVVRSPEHLSSLLE